MPSQATLFSEILTKYFLWKEKEGERAKHKAYKQEAASAVTTDVLRHERLKIQSCAQLRSDYQLMAQLIITFTTNWQII